MQTRKRKKIDIDKVRQFAMQGLTKDEIAYSIGITPKTLYNHIGKYGRQDIEDAISEGRSRGKAVITNKLFTMAQSGNLGAICFYLKCHGWSERSTVDHVSSDGSMASQPITINLSDMTPEQVAAMAKAAFEGKTD